MVALALSAISEVANADMIREVAPDIAKRLQDSNSYIRKKAGLAAVRALKKNNELVDEFHPKLEKFLEDRHHGSLIAALVLAEEITKIKPEIGKKYVRKALPYLIKRLKELTNGYSPEYIISGVCDPFLQVSILHLFGVCGKGDESFSDDVAEALAHVATSLSSQKNAGNAVLYECVKTIMSIQSSPSLKATGVNILGKLLSFKDSNNK